MDYHLATSIKDEGPFLLEWIAHHKVAGFNRILIGYNDCTDGSEKLLRLLAYMNNSFALIRYAQASSFIWGFK